MVPPLIGTVLVEFIKARVDIWPLWGQVSTECLIETKPLIELLAQRTYNLPLLKHSNPEAIEGILRLAECGQGKFDGLAPYGGRFFKPRYAGGGVTAFNASYTNSIAGGVYFFQGFQNLKEGWERREKH